MQQKQQNSKDIILEVLTISGYQGNKEVYADKFIQNCEKQAFIDVISALPEDKQNDYRGKMVWAKDTVQQKAIIAEYVPPEQYKETLKRVSEIAFKELIEAIMPTL